MSGTVQCGGSCSDAVRSGHSSVWPLSKHALCFPRVWKQHFPPGHERRETFQLGPPPCQDQAAQSSHQGAVVADNAALTTYTGETLQWLITRVTEACNELGLTISLKRTKIMGQDVSETPQIRIDDHALEAVDNFTYLGSCILRNLSLDSELNFWIGYEKWQRQRLA